MSDENEKHVDRLGMWVFLCTEALLFGVIFSAILVYRFLHPGPCDEAARHLSLPIGTINTALLLTSSWLVAIAVQRQARRWLYVSAFLGVLFLALKFFEYWLHYQEGLVPGLRWTITARPEFELFLILYFISTLLHALHLLIGVGLLLFTAMTKTTKSFLSNIGLYWHFVDLIWIFLFPLLYLWGRSA